MESHEDLVFHLEVLDEDGELVVKVGGEFDAHAAQSFDHAMDDLVGRAPERVVIDLAGVSFIDSSGLRSLALANALMERPANAAQTKAGTPVPAYLLENGGIG